MKKNIITLGLTVVMSVAIGLTAFGASPITSAAGSDNKDVKGTYKAGTASATVYSVDVSWGTMEFNFTDAAKGTWNPKTHKYDNATEAKWEVKSTDGDKITVTNNSNTAVTAGFAFTQKVSTAKVKFSGEGLSENKISLATADNGLAGAAGTPTSKSVTLKVSGTMKSTDSALGTVTVTLE